MMLPGLISLAFYKRAPSLTQISIGFGLTLALSAILGYYSPPGPLTVLGSVVVAVIGASIIYLSVLAYLLYRYLPAHGGAPESAASPTAR